MTILGRLCIFVVLAPMLCLAASGEADINVQRILEAIESAQDEATVRSKMGELVALDSPAAATAFAEQLDRIRTESENSIPYLNMLFDFSGTSDIRDSLVPTLERILASDVDKGERLYLSAALARFGAQEKVQWLIDEYIRTKPDFSTAYSSTVYELLCKTDQNRAVRYVVEEAVQSTDPTVKLGAEYCLREMRNPAALEIMRRWDTIQTGDYDLVVADRYLKSIIEFGDERDAEMVEWIDANVDDQFGVYAEDVRSQLDPLIKAATARIEPNRRPQLPKVAIVLLVILGIALATLVALRRTRKPKT